MAILNYFYKRVLRNIIEQINSYYQVTRMTTVLNFMVIHIGIPRAWFGKVTKSMKTFGYSQSDSNHTILLKKGQGNYLCWWYGGDSLTGNDQDEISNMQQHHAYEFEIKQHGNLKYFLEIELARSKHGIFLSQPKYILDLLSETGMLGCKPIDIPIEQNDKLFQCLISTSTGKGRYQRLVGKSI